MIASFRAALGIAESDLRQQIKSGMFFSNIIVAIIFTLILGYALGISSSPKNLPINVYDPQHLIKFKNTDLVQIHEQNSEKTSIDQVRTGESVGAVIIQNNRVLLVLDDTNGNSINGVVMKEIGEQILGSNNPGAQLLNNGSVKVQYLFGLDPNSDWYTLKLFAAQLMPVAVFFFALVVMGESLITEKKDRTLFELAMAPVRPIWVILGKLLSGALTLILVILIVFPITVFVFGVHPNGNIFALMLTCFVMGLGFAGLAYTLSALFPTTEMYRSIVSLILIFPLLFISGIFAPVRSYPQVVQGISKYLPLNWAVEAVKTLTFKSGTFTDIRQPLLQLVVFLVVTLILGPFAVGSILNASRRS
jgi:ABC-2 type transport system permease protein